MRYFDFVCQTTLILATIVIVVPMGTYGMLIGQMMIGAWQVASSIICVTTKRPHRKYRLIHLALATVYLAFFAAFANTIFSPRHESLFFMFIAAAWVIATYYFALTAWSTFSTTKRSKFLPNISF